MPEKSSHEVSRQAREMYEKGRAAFEKANYDYAIAILSQVLAKEPAFYECREALRASQFKKAGGGGGFLKKMFGSASHSPLLAKGQLLLRHNPADALAVAEQVLSADPQHAGAHKLVAEAALALDLPRTAVLSLEIVNKHTPGDRDVVEKLGIALTRAGEVGKAEAVVGEYVREHPQDAEMAQVLKNVSANRTMTEGGYDALAGGQGSYRDVLRDKDEAVRLEQENRDVKPEDIAARLIQDYEARLPREPNNTRLMRELAELHTQKKNFDRALALYGQIADHEGAQDPTIEKMVAETVARKIEHAIAQLDPDLPDRDAQVRRLQEERQQHLLTSAKRRVDRYPNDLQYRFELGQLYFEAGQITEAIQEFQKAQNNPHRRIQALFGLSRCFSRRGIHDLAARTLQTALKEKLVFDDEKKDLLYALGCALEKMNQPDEAIAQFKLIYESDIGFKDVAARVDAYYAAKATGG